MKLYDALTYLGRDLSLASFQTSDLDSLRGVLDKYGIERAVVSPFSAKNLELDYGNGVLFDTCAKDERLTPSPVIVPNSSMEVGDEGAYLDGLIQNGARWVSFYPSTCGTTLDRRVIGSLFEALEERRLPVAVFESDLLELATLASDYPKLPIVMHIPPTRARIAFPALRGSPNLYISLAPNFSPYRGLEVFIEEMGGDRVLFASGYPVSEPGAPIYYMLLSKLSAEDVEKIAWRNMDRLMREVRAVGQTEEEGEGNQAEDAVPAQTKAPPRVAGICDSVWRRERLPWDGIVDMHGHYGKYAKFRIFGGDADDLVEEMDRVGVEKILVSHHACISTEVVWGNNEVLDGMKRCSGRILGYATCYPANGDLGIREIERCIDAGMPGIKLHNSNGFAYTDGKLKPVWEYANEHKLPVLLHTWGDVNKLDSILDTYSDTPILFGHSGCVNEEMYAEYARKYPNVYLELCHSGSRYGLVEYFVREVGAERILFGSDAPWMGIQQQLGRILFADITDDEKKTILIENPRRVLEGELNAQ